MENESHSGRSLKISGYREEVNDGKRESQVYEHGFDFIRVDPFPLK